MNQVDFSWCLMTSDTKRHISINLLTYTSYLMISLVLLVSNCLFLHLETANMQYQQSFLDDSFGIPIDPL